MTKSVEQQVSELVDGELDAKEMDSVLSALRKDARLSRQWERSFVVREALRQGLPKCLHNDIASRVRKALESEPSYLLPSAASRNHVSYTSSPPLHTASTFKRKAVVGLAAAASVMLVVGAVVVKMEVSTVAELSESPQFVQPAPVSASFAAAPSAAMPSVTVVSVFPATTPPNYSPTQNAQQVWDHLPPQPGLSLDAYLVDHSAYSENNTVRGFLPYARVVGYPTQAKP
ncbi:MAG: sigma-E factor negative regulatory protein [Pseudomonadota bacterium]